MCKKKNVNLNLECAKKMKKYYLRIRRKKNNEVFSMQISRYLLSLIRLLNEVFIYHYYTKRTNKIKYYL